MGIAPAVTRLRSTRPRSSADRGSIRLEYKVSIGFVVGLDYADLTLSVHDILQQFKLHPLILGTWTAASASCGGPRRSPRTNIGRCPSARRRGCSSAATWAAWSTYRAQGHPLRHGSRSLAAEQIVAAQKINSADRRAYDHAVRDSMIGRDLYRARNMKQPFGRGFFIGGAITNAMVVTGGSVPGRSL